MKKKWLKETTASMFCLSVMASLIVLSGCPKPEQSARDAIAVSKGVIETAQDKYQAECQLDPSLRPCMAVNKAVAAQNLAIDALNLYCSGQSYLNGGPCEPNREYQPRLSEALRNLNQIIAEVEALVR